MDIKEKIDAKIYKKEAFTYIRKSFFYKRRNLEC